MMEPITVSVRGAVALMGINRTAVYRLLSEGKLVAVKSGRITLIPVAGIREYLSSLEPAEFRAPPGSS